MNPILLVDDDPHHRLCLRDFLEHHGYPCIEAVHGADALATLRAQPVSLIMTDIHMPVMTGMELLDTLRAHHSYDHICRFVISGDLTEDLQVQAGQLGATKVFPKPFNFQQILQAVHEVIDTPSQENPLK